MNYTQVRGEIRMIFIWIGICIASILIELLTPTALICIWFGVGAIFGALTALLDLSLWIQITSFLVVSLVSMLLVRPFATHYLRGNTIATNADRFIGSIGIVTKNISRDEWGEVKVQGTSWHAIAVDNSDIEELVNVKVIAIEGAKLLVKRVS